MSDGLPGRLGSVRMDGELPDRRDLGVVFDELDYQMAAQLYLWSLPIVSMAQWQHDHREMFGATNVDIVHYVSYRDRLGIITANATTPYLMTFPDLAVTGPLVIEVPAGKIAGGFGDFWQREFGSLGEMGPDKGAGGKHLLVPPGQEPPTTEGHFVHVATGMNVFAGFRILDTDPQSTADLLAGIAIYPYGQRDDLPATRIIEPDGRAYTSVQPRGLDYWRRLHDIYQTEIVDERDRFFLAMMRQLGLGKSEPFAPDDRMSRILEDGAASGELMAQANTFAKRFAGSKHWPDRQWDLAIVLDSSNQRGPYYDELLERASWFYEALSYAEAMKSQVRGQGQAYLGSYYDANGDWLDGGRNYTLHVPADVPAQLFWSATVYSVDTRCLIDNPQSRGDRGSRDPDLTRNDDGSVDLYFGPDEPNGQASNWIQTIPGQHWFSYFRFYGPLEPYFDRSWKLGDITPT
jgi:hypothetical protein